MLYSHPEAPPLPCATPPERPPSRPRPRPQPRTHGHEPAAHQALRPPGLEDTGRAQVGAGRRRARRQRRFVTRTYLSPILLSSTPRRMGERYVHVGKVRSRSGPLHAGARTCQMSSPIGCSTAGSLRGAPVGRGVRRTLRAAAGAFRPRRPQQSLPARDRSRGTRGARCRASIGPGTLKDLQEADLEPPFPPDARPRPLTYDHASRGESQRTTARGGSLTYDHASRGESQRTTARGGPLPGINHLASLRHDARRAVATGSKQAEQGRARGAGLSLPARGPAASRGSPGSLLSGRAHPPSPERIVEAPCDPDASRPGQSQGVVPHGPHRPAAVTM